MGMNEARAREEICRIGRSLFDRGYVHGTSGNISVRLDDGFLITPTDACLGFLEPMRLAHVDRHGQQIGGDKCSKTLALHLQIYAATQTEGVGIRCVLHTHSQACVALSLRLQGQAELLPPLTPYFVMKVGRVPLIPYARPGALSVAEEVVRTVDRMRRAGSSVRAVMLERLGPVVWHESPLAAMAVLEELEQTARLWQDILDSPRASHIEALSPAQIAELCQTFGANW
jgi:ribulose-5-phosphate 4-epimerase/fuculose-1-phosphate aldolase